MNKDLKNQEFPIPGDVLMFINKMLDKGYKGVKGVDRAIELTTNKSVTYTQLKRILHDMENLNKETDKITYNLYGGEGLENWARNTLENNRKQVKNQKQATKTSKNITGKLGIKNPFLKTHEKQSTFKTPINTFKSNSDKTSISPLLTGKLFEEINRIKQLL